MKKHNLIKYAAALCLSAVCLLFSASDAKADYVYDNANGISYNDTVYISKGYADINCYGGAAYVSVHLDNDGDRVTNVKSKSKYVLAKKTSESYDITTETQGQNVQITTERYSNTCISFFGKKKGSYKVTFDVVDKEGIKKCTKTIKVHVDKYVSTASAIKSITYAGKNIWECYPYCSKNSGKLKVKLNKGYSLVSIYVYKVDKKGNWKGTKVKNGKKITLAKSGKCTIIDEWHTIKDNPLLPMTHIEINVKNKKTKETQTYLYDLFTLNKK